MFRPTLVAALAYSDGARGGRPPDDPVTMLEVLVLVAPYNVSAARMEYLIRDRLTAVGALDTVFADFDRRLKERGYLPMGGRIVDALLVAAPKRGNTRAERAAVKEGKSADEIWPDEPAKARPTADGKPQPDIAIPGLLQEHDLDRPRLRRHPQGQGHRRTPAQGCGHQRQHR